MDLLKNIPGDTKIVVYLNNIGFPIHVFPESFMAREWEVMSD